MQLVRESLYDDVYYANLLNEGISIEKIKDAVSKIKDKSKVLNQFIQKFNQAKDVSVKKHVAHILVILTIMNFIGRNNVWGDISIGKLSNEVAKETSVDVKKLNDIAKKALPVKISKFNYKTAKTSEKVKEFIKEHEKLRLTAYAIGDDRITIGYGHSYPEKQSPYLVGHKISQEKADQLFDHDITKTENGLKRLFSKWEKEGVKVNINQSMFDAMVSMAYNMGISGLIRTEFISLLKQGKYDEAAEKIKTTKTGSTIKKKGGESKYVPMPGLITRRDQESKIFSQNL